MYVSTTEYNSSKITKPVWRQLTMMKAVLAEIDDKLYDLSRYTIRDDQDHEMAELVREITASKAEALLVDMAKQLIVMAGCLQLEIADGPVVDLCKGDERETKTVPANEVQ